MNANNKIEGLLTQKPDSPVPQVGQTRRFSVIPKTGRNSGKPWNKIKSDEGYGQLYEIASVQKTDHTDSYGNVSFNVSLTLLDSSINGSCPKPSNGNGALTKDETSRRMGRAHAQDMAIAYATLKGLTEIKPEELRALIGWFERDVDMGPYVKVQPEPPPIKELSENAEAQMEQGKPEPDDEGFDL